jgi:hypothetical protein
MRNDYRKLFGLSLLAFLPCGVAYSDAPTSDTALLTAINTQLQTLTQQNQSQLQTLATGQSQLQQSFQNYTLFQLQLNYPTTAFPGADQVQISQINWPSANNGVGYLNSVLSQNTSQQYQSEVRSQLLNDVVTSLSMPVDDSTVSTEVNNYIDLVSNTSVSMTPVQAAQLTNQLLALNLKTNYLQYQEQKRLEKLMVAELVIQMQQNQAAGGVNNAAKS